MSRFLTNLVVGLGSGLVGAVALTAAHEALRKNQPVSPRMDVLGMRALKKLGSAVGLNPGRGRELRRNALVFDLATNAAWFGLVAPGRRPITRGLVLGLLAGLGAVALPPMLGLGRGPRGRTKIIQAETVGLYVLGGIAAAGVAWMARSARDRNVLTHGRQEAEYLKSRVNTRDSGMIH